MPIPKSVFIIISFLVIRHLSFAQLSQVNTQSGLVAGDKVGELIIFKGIPFAAPPIGDHRWKAPKPAAKWKGVRQCTAFSASPFQPKPAPFYCWSEEFIAPPEPLSEDCLYLNIWTGAKSKSEKRPVFVWIYGGGFSSGSAACAIYDGAEMAKRGIIFVSINYRVGPFGFMAHPELSKEQNNTSGNYGIMDQVAALRWIQKNISAFGGDPQQVTIAGQSAGSMSVFSLVASPLAKGLFQRAIAQSGGIIDGLLMSPLASAEKNGLAIQQQTGAKNLSELRKKTAAEILLASQSKEVGRLGLTLDGFVLPADLGNAFASQKFNQVPMLMGWVSGDASLFGASDITAEKFKQQAVDKYGTRSGEFLKIFPATTNEAAQYNQSRLTLLSFAAYPAHKLAGYNPNPSYVYQVVHVPTDKPGFPNYGAFHTSEVPYALHTLHTWKRPWQQHDYDVEGLMSTYWLQFIKTGNPNGNGLPEWKPYNKTEGAILEIDATSVLKPALFKNELDVLESLDSGK
ncbi:carboxylesterase/lipase family protein [Flavihumibacter fluvii]|uniref:carboxylesterase/lipase family protein n=1 Tax=Flavihumibacter fluvii TaxID=2838157 RepID=UPI001BDDE74A|nr:carboxylesterase family protein [Flavihumibacter fluvii]ULQ54044.1 carboxylesterase family protein [Flavihumibacter fluvii]